MWQVPLVYESFDWRHGTFLGSTLRSETTSAAEFKGKKVVHDPFSMRPFLGYNFGDYMQHWLGMEQAGRQMPKVFMVNWFRRDESGEYLWPGFGENVRVLEWIFDRCDEKQDSAERTPIGYIPKITSLQLDGMKKKFVLIHKRTLKGEKKSVLTGGYLQRKFVTLGWVV